MQRSSPVHLVASTSAATPEDLGDDDLMLLVQNGEPRAFEILIRRHQHLVLGLACRTLGDEALGRDVLQDVFAALWSERTRYRPQGKFRSFLVSMTIHRCHTVARARRNHTRKLDQVREARALSQRPSDSPLDELLLAAKKRELRARLTRLPERMRTVLILRFTNGMALDEIAACTGMPIGTVKTQIFRGLKRLSEQNAEVAS